MRKGLVKRLSAITAAMLLWTILPMGTFAQVATPSEIETPAAAETPVMAAEEPTPAPDSADAEAEGTKEPEPTPVGEEETGAPATTSTEPSPEPAEEAETEEPESSPEEETTATPTGEEGTPAPATEKPEPTPTTEATEAPTPAPDPAIVAFDTSAIPEGFAVPYGTAEGDLGLPDTLKATLDDGTTMQVAVSWACVSDGLGGTGYNAHHENPAEALFTFRAELTKDVLCGAEMPEVGVVFEATSMLLAADAEAVLYSAASTFTVTIPAAASVNDGSMTITCGELNGGTVTVEVTSANNWQLTSDDASIGYQLTAGGAAVKNGGTVASFDEAGSMELTLGLTDPTAVYPVGTYKDTLTFAISTD